MPLGVALIGTVFGSLLLALKYLPSVMDQSTSRYKHLSWLRGTSEALWLGCVLPAFGTLHRSVTTTAHQRHFGYVALLIALGTAALAVLLRVIWWLLAGFLAAAEDGGASTS